MTFSNLPNLIVLTLLILFSIDYCSAQNQDLGIVDKWSDKYLSEKIDGVILSDFADRIGFEPTTILRNGAKISKEQFKLVLLKMSYQAYQQIDIDAWYLCSAKHEEYFRLWNYYYPDISKSYYDTHCKKLIALMLFDSTAEAPKPN